MNKFYSHYRKIDPAKGEYLGDNTPNDKNRIEIGPTQAIKLETTLIDNLRRILQLCTKT